MRRGQENLESQIWLGRKPRRPSLWRLMRPQLYQQGLLALSSCKSQESLRDPAYLHEGISKSQDNELQIADPPLLHLICEAVFVLFFVGNDLLKCRPILRWDEVSH